ncbi:hypothetical protein [Bacillus sp. 2205SS5-2]|uniref:hypothetical protein n=1 Tax=Bacillus sp. 2205SS5-2 TaxID=3109031 RepID=UPI003005945A
MRKCYLYINEYIIPEIYSPYYYDDFMVPCHNQSTFISDIYKENTMQLDNNPSSIADSSAARNIGRMVQEARRKQNLGKKLPNESRTFDISLANEDQHYVLSKFTKQKKSKKRRKNAVLKTSGLGKYVVDIHDALYYSKYDPNNNHQDEKHPYTFQKKQTNQTPAKKTNLPSFSIIDFEVENKTDSEDIDVIHLANKVEATENTVEKQPEQPRKTFTSSIRPPSPESEIQHPLEPLDSTPSKTFTDSPDMSDPQIIQNNDSADESEDTPYQEHPFTIKKKQKDDHTSFTSLLNKQLVLGDSINVYAGNKLLDKKGTFVTAGKDFFIWIDGEGDVRLQVISGSLSVAKVKRNQ